MGKITLGIAIRAVQPEMRPFFGFDAEPAWFRPNRPKTDPNGRRRVRSGVLWSLICVPCAPNWQHSVADLDRGPLGAVWGRFGCFFWPVPPRFSPVLRAQLATKHHRRALESSQCDLGPFGAVFGRFWGLVWP